MNSEQIRRTLTEYGIKQQWLADKLGVSKGTISLWLSGRNIPEDQRQRIKELLRPFQVA